MKKSIVAVLLLMTLVVGCKQNVEVENQVEVEEVVSDVYKIALVTDPILDNSEFLSQAKNELYELEGVHGFEATHVEAENTVAWTERTKEFGDLEYDLVIGVGWQSGEVFSTLEDRYKDTKFATIDCIASDEDIKGVVYNSGEGAYILGAMVASAFPEKDIFGYVGNYDNESNHEYLHGYEAGLLSVNPEATVLVDYANTYADSDVVYELASAQAKSGATFIMGSVSSNANEGVYRLALELGETDNPIYTSGLSVDQTTEENPYIVTGLIKDTGVALNMLIHSFLGGDFTSKAVELGVVSGGFGVVHITTESANYLNDEMITGEVLAVGKKAFEEIMAYNQ